MRVIIIEKTIKGSRGIFTFLNFFFLIAIANPYAKAENTVKYPQTIMLFFPVKSPVIKSILTSPWPRAFSLEMSTINWERLPKIKAPKRLSYATYIQLLENCNSLFEKKRKILIRERKSKRAIEIALWTSIFFISTYARYIKQEKIKLIVKKYEIFNTE